MKRKGLSTNKLKVVNTEPEKVEPWSESDYEEWMDRSGLCMKTDWVKYDKNRLLRPCDVRTRDGEEIGPCWKNGDFFIRVDDLDRVLATDVEYIREYTDVPGIREDESDEDLLAGEIEENLDEYNEE